MLARSDLNLPEVSSKVVLGFLVPVVCNFLVFRGVFLPAFCRHTDSNYFYISKSFSKYVLFLF